MASKQQQLRDAVKAAREAIDNKEWREAMKQCKTALALDPSNYNACIFVGVAATELGQDARSEQAYRKAIEVDATKLLAWQGLVKLYAKLAQWDKLAEVYEELLKSFYGEDKPKRREETIIKLAQTFMKANDANKALERWKEVLQLDVEHERKLEAWKAIAQLLEQRLGASNKGERDEATREELENVYQSIMQMNIPNTAEYWRKHVEGLQRAVQATEQEKKIALRSQIVQKCREMWSNQPTDHFSLENLLLASEEDDTEVSKEEAAKLSKCLTHSFPYHPISWLCFARLLVERSSSVAATHHRTQLALERERKAQALEDAIELCEAALRLFTDDISGWLFLADLYQRKAHHQRTLQCVEEGFKVIQRREKESGATFRRLELELRLISAVALQRSGKGPEAKAAYKDILAQKPTSIVSLMGLAKIATEEEQWHEAAQYYELVIEQEPTNADALFQLGLLFYNQQKYHASAKRLLLAIEANNREPMYRFWLGRAYWEIGGEHRANKEYAKYQFMHGAKLNPNFAGNFVYLGKYYQEVEKDELSAKRCYQKALNLNPTEREAGIALSQLYESSNNEREYSLAVRLWLEVTSHSTRADWAWRKLGMHQLRKGRYEEAARSLQNVLRLNNNEAEDDVCWKALGDAYIRQGKYMAALKAFSKAVELRPSAVTYRYAIAETKLTLGMTEEAIQQFKSIMQDCHPSMKEEEGTEEPAEERRNKEEQRMVYLSVMKGMAETLLLMSKEKQREGFWAIAANYLTQARQTLHTCLNLRQDLLCIWKLLGDAYSQTHHLPLYPASDSKNDSDDGEMVDDDTTCKWQEWTSNNVRQAQLKRLGMLQKGHEAYEKALSLSPASSHTGKPVTSNATVAALHHDLAVNLYYQSNWTSGILASAKKTELETTASELLKRSVEQMKQAVRINPDSPTYWKALGTILESSDLPLSQHAFIQALQLNENDAEAWSHLAMLYLANGHLDLADKAFTTAQSKNPDIAATWFGHGLLSLQHYQEQRRKELKGDPAAHPLHASSASFLDAAVSSFAEARNLPDNTASTELAMGYTCFLLGNFNEARVALQRYVQCSPLSSAGAWNILGIVQERLNLFSQAHQSYSRALQLLQIFGKDRGQVSFGSSSDGVSNLQRSISFSIPSFYSASISEKTVPEMEVAVAWNMARILRKLGRLEESCNLYEKQVATLQKSAPNSLDFCKLQREMGAVYFAKGQLEASQQCYEDVLNTLQQLQQSSSAAAEKMHKKTLLLLSQISYYRHNIDAAKQYIIQCLQRDKDYALGWKQMSALGLVIQDYAAAEKALHRLVQVEGPTAESYHMLAAIAVQQGKRAEAKRHMCKAIHLYPGDDQVWNAFGEFVLRDCPSGELTSEDVYALALNYSNLNQALGSQQATKQRKELLALSLLFYGRGPLIAPNATGNVITGERRESTSLHAMAALKEALCALQSQVVMNPSFEQNSEGWYLLALAAYSQAALSEKEDRWNAACRLLQQVIDQFCQQQKKGEVNDGDYRLETLQLSLCDGLLHRRQREYKEKGLKMARELVERFENNKKNDNVAIGVMTYRQLARALLCDNKAKENSIEEALQAYKQAIRFYQRFYRLPSSSSPSEKEMETEAANDADEALLLVLTEMSHLYAHSGSSKAAEACLIQCFEVTGRISQQNSSTQRQHDFVNLLRLSKLYYESEMLKEAQVQAFRAVKTQDKQPIALLLQGIIYYYARDFKKAKISLTKTLRYNHPNLAAVLHPKAKQQQQQPQEKDQKASPAPSTATTPTAQQKKKAAETQKEKEKEKEKEKDDEAPPPKKHKEYELKLVNYFLAQTAKELKDYASWESDILYELDVNGTFSEGYSSLGQLARLGKATTQARRLMAAAAHIDPTQEHYWQQLQQMMATATIKKKPPTTSTPAAKTATTKPQKSAAQNKKK
ncbi:Tetratricopeptide repeat protein 37 [Balamuthia mandrillaris]